MHDYLDTDCLNLSGERLGRLRPVLIRGFCQYEVS